MSVRRNSINDVCEVCQYCDKFLKTICNGRNALIYGEIDDDCPYSEKGED